MIRCAIAAVTMLVLGGHPALGRAEGEASPRCAGAGGLQFICGAEHPEDLAYLPGTRWMIASGFSVGAGLKLLDLEGHTATTLQWTSAPMDRRGERIGAECPSAPDPKTFDTQGLSLRPVADGRYRLYVVNHGGRESIEIFDVAPGPGAPSLAWRGCVLMPPGHAANGVASYPDGTILATVLTRPGTTITDFVLGRKTGGVYEWRPGEPRFSLLRGTELRGNNGLETSPDGKSFFVVEFGTHSILKYSRSDTRRPLRRAIAPGFMPDNIHWSGGRLIAAGMTYDEPACGGVRKVVAGKADDMRCHRGYVVASIDPRTLGFTVRAYAEPNPEFNGVSTAVIVADELWLGSYQADRVAHRALPARGPAEIGSGSCKCGEGLRCP